jgi:hypothetical protein
LSRRCHPLVGPARQPRPPLSLSLLLPAFPPPSPSSARTPLLSLAPVPAMAPFGPAQPRRPRPPRPSPDVAPPSPLLACARPRPRLAGAAPVPTPARGSAPVRLPLACARSGRPGAPAPDPPLLGGLRGAPASPRSGRGVLAPCGAAPCARPRPGPGVSPRPCSARPRHGAASACAGVVPLCSAARAQLGPGVCATRSRRINAALRVRSRVVRVVLWHSSPCPRRTRLPPRRARLPPCVTHA